MDRKTLTITAIVSALVFIGMLDTMTREGGGFVQAISGGAFIFLVTWGVVAGIRWAKRHFERKPTQA